MADSRAKKVLEYIDTKLVEQQRKLLKGECEAATPEQTAVNYKAAVEVNRSMTAFRKEIAAIFSKEEEDDGE